MSIYRGPGGAGDAVADSSSEALLVRELAIEVQADADAAEAAKNAAQSAQAAAELAENNAETAETNAETAETNAETAATAAASSASTATTQAGIATTQATNASNSATAAASSATTAATQATNASNSASSALTSATNAASSATASATSATNSANSATASASSATTAATQATNAANSATSAATSATNASNSATSASNSASTATTQAGIASTQATNSANSATAAATSATNASNSATAAAGSATNASTSASAASTSATNASNSATAAAGSASSAASSLLAVQQVFDDFDDIYLGSKSSDPTVDNDGDPLVAGAVYFNTTDEEVRFYNGTAWERPEYAASQSALAAQSSATSASNSASSASTSATNSANSASAALTSANNAATSETNASTSASAAATSATNASNSASSASTSATNAFNSATSAATSATNAAASATAASDSAILASSYTPSQTGNSGKYLTTDGTNTSWDALAAVANSGAYSDLSGTPSLATVATSGSYNDLSNKPTIPTNLDSLTDVVITSPTTNQSLVYNGTNWVNSAGGGGVTSFNTRTGAVTLSSGDVTGALGYTPYNSTNPSGYVTSSGSVNYATNAGSADQAFEWKGSGSTSNWNTHFQDTLPASCTQIDINGGTDVPTGGGWWFAQSFRHSNSSNFWGTQYAHGWEDRAYIRYVRNVSSNNFGSWQLDTGCRAWVNFNGSGTVSIRASGNVSSISDLGAGYFQVNFSTALIDANYAVSIAISAPVNSNVPAPGVATNQAPTSSNFRITVNQSGIGQQDPVYTNVSVFR